jgi:agmatinase
MLAAIHEMAQLDIVGMDLLEVSPPNDVSDMTSILAAKIIREALIAY